MTADTRDMSENMTVLLLADPLEVVNVETFCSKLKYIKVNDPNRLEH